MTDIEADGDLSLQQFGFRDGKTTAQDIQKVCQIADKANTGLYKRTQVYALFILDIRNRFNSTPWDGIIKVLRNRKVKAWLINVIQNYFSKRKIMPENDIIRRCSVPRTISMECLLS